MKTSVIRQRVADFLKSWAPFDALSEADLLELAGSGRVKFHQANEYVFRRGDSPAQILWIIQQGRVDLLDGEHLHDVLGEGDLIGLERFAGNGRSRYSARTTSDVILYGVSADLFSSLIQRYPSLKRFLSADSSTAGASGFGRTSWLDAEAPALDFLRARHVAISANASVEETAAALDAARSRVAAIVDERHRAIAFVSATDINRVTVALSSPVTTRAAIRALVNMRSEEAAVTADGTLDGRLDGVLTASALALFCNYNPVQLIREIRNAESTAETAPLLEQARRMILNALAEPRDVDDCCGLGRAVMIAIVESCVERAEKSVRAAGLTTPAVPWCWVLCGASARDEIMTPVFPALSILYDDSSAAFNVEDRVYFEAWAAEVEALLRTCGLADEPVDWSVPCAPASQWSRSFSDLILDPLRHDLYARREQFDVSGVFVESSIVAALLAEVESYLREHSLVIPLLANDTLANLPPLTFFRGLVLDWDGAQREDLDIVKTAIAPIVDAARVFAIAKRRLTPVDTLDRLRAAEAEYPEAAAIFADAASAFRIALYYQASSGKSRIVPSELGKFDQRLLKTAFSSIQVLLEFTTSTFIPDAS